MPEVLASQFAQGNPSVTTVRPKPKYFENVNNPVAEVESPSGELPLADFRVFDSDKEFYVYYEVKLGDAGEYWNMDNLQFTATGVPTRHYRQSHLATILPKWSVKGATALGSVGSVSADQDTSSSLYDRNIRELEEVLGDLRKDSLIISGLGLIGMIAVLRIYYLGWLSPNASIGMVALLAIIAGLGFGTAWSAGLRSSNDGS